MEVLVFKTNVTSKTKVNKVRTLLTSFPSIRQWNFDLEDCDKILRVEGKNIPQKKIVRMVTENGYQCSVLE